MVEHHRLQAAAHGHEEGGDAALAESSRRLTLHKPNNGLTKQGCVGVKRQHW